MFSVTPASRSEELRAMEWKAKYETGHPVIDQQHQGLFRSINEFSRTLEDDDCNEKAGEMLRLLVGYVHEHFSEEEKLMEAIDFPLREHQRRLHHAFAEAIRKILLDLQANKPLDLYEFDAFLRKWIVNHILIEDLKYVEYL